MCYHVVSWLRTESSNHHLISNSDPFVEMAKAKKVYGYTMAIWERGDTVPSLFHQVTRYKEKLKIPSTDLWKSFIDPSWAPFPFRPLMSSLRGRDSHGDGWNWCHYWSNFEIADMDWYRSKEYMAFFEMLDELGGFYYERVGLFTQTMKVVADGRSGVMHRFTRLALLSC